jgi:hypothetical protein
MTFSQQVNELFFGVEISNKSASLIESLRSIPQLRYSDNGARQFNLNATMEMKSDKAWSSRHEFSFSESPLPDLQIEMGTIEITLVETDNEKKLLNLNWQLQFKDKISATKYFDKLNQLFGDFSTIKKFEKDKDVGDIAQFSTSNSVDTGIRDITFFLSKSPMTKKYEVSLVFGTEFTDK